MADAGIKISKLDVVKEPLPEDYTVLVHGGITQRTYLSSIQDIFTNGQQIDLQNIKDSIAKIENGLSAISNNISAISDDYVLNYTNIQKRIKELTSETDILSDAVDLISSNLDDLSGNINSISALTTNPEMLSLLIDVAKLLSGEDGSASLKRLIDEVEELSSGISVLTEDLAVFNRLQNVIEENYKDKIEQQFNEDTNSAYALSYNNNYDFYYDKNHFANILNRPDENVLLSVIALSGWKMQDNNRIISVITGIDYKLCANEISGATTTAISDYYILSTVVGLSNCSMISSHGFRRENNDEFTVDVDYSVSILTAQEDQEDSESPVISTAYLLSGIEMLTYIPFKGEDTFPTNIEMIPIRSGMFDIQTYVNEEDSKTYVDRVLFSTKILGDSDLELYYLNNAPIFDNYTAKINVYIDNELVSIRKSTIDKSPDLFDMNLTFKRRVQGGTVLRFEVDNVLTASDGSTTKNMYELNPADLERNDYTTLIAALRPIVFASQTRDESMPPTISLLSVTTNKVDEQQEYQIRYNIENGANGEEWTVSVYNQHNDENDCILSDIYSVDNNPLIENGYQTMTLERNEDSPQIQQGDIITLSAIKEFSDTIYGSESIVFQ